VYVVCRDHAGRLLLTRFVAAGHPDSGKWTMPGGAMEWGESPLETAVRELDEETGLEATSGPILGVVSRWYTETESVRGESGHALGIIYVATVVTGQRRTSFAEGTTDAARWIEIDEVHHLERVELVDFVLTLV
jgi:ADP-ribose pyrophosphatase YjhB (NUDIX family)